MICCLFCKSHFCYLKYFFLYYILISHNILMHHSLMNVQYYHLNILLFLNTHFLHFLYSYQFPIVYYMVYNHSDVLLQHMQKYLSPLSYSRTLNGIFKFAILKYSPCFAIQGLNFSWILELKTPLNVRLLFSYLSECQVATLTFLRMNITSIHTEKPIKKNYLQSVWPRHSNR